MANYIEAEELKKEILEYKKEFSEFEKKVRDLNLKSKKERNEHRPTCSKKLCSYFYLIANHLLGKWKYDYSEKEDMVQMAVEYCVRYAHNCNEERTGRDMFAYLTEICISAFFQYFGAKNRDKIMFDKYIENVKEELYLCNIKNGIRNYTEIIC
jgi:hypothetical protein